MKYSKVWIALTVVITITVVCVFVKASPLSVIEQYESVDIPELNQTAKRMVLENKMDSALMIYNIIINSHNADKHHQLVSNAYNNAGYIYFYAFSNYEKAYQCWLTTKEMIEKYDLEGMETPLLNLGNMYLILQNGEKAIDYFSQGFHLCAEQGLNETLLTLYNNIALIVGMEPAYKVGVKDVIDYDLNQIPDSVPMRDYAIYMQQGLKMMAQNKELEAIPFFKEASKKINTIFSPDRFEVAVGEICAGIYARHHLYENAIQEYLYADSIAEIYNQNDHRISIQKELAKSYKALGKTEEALRHFEASYAIGDTVFNQNLYYNLHSLETKAEIDKISQ